MKRPHHILLTLLCTLLLHHLFLPSLFSQESASLYRRGATMMESTLPPAPESFSMVKYADVPFSHSRGLAELHIPLYTLQGRHLSVPVTLSYLSGGIAIGEVSGVSGLGWRLSAGGCVTRTVVDMPDEFESLSMRHLLPEGDLLASLVSRSPSSESLGYLRRLVWHSIESSLDRYSYSVCGLSGTFLITSRDSVIHLSGDGTSVSFSRGDDNGITSFTLTGPDGTLYSLAVRETGRHDGTRDEIYSPPYGAPDLWEATTAWHLSEIRDRNGLERAVLNYGEALRWRCDRRSDRETLSQERLRGSGYTISTSKGFTGTCIFRSYDIRPLESIVLSGDTVSFIYSEATGRSMLTVNTGENRDNYPLRLSGVRVSVPGRRELLRVDVGTVRAPRDGRIILESLRLFRNGVAEDRWDFTYNTLPSTPSRHSRDWFGYYNGDNDTVRGTLSSSPYTMDIHSCGPLLTRGYPSATKAAYMSLHSADHDGATTTFHYEGAATGVRISGKEITIGVRVKKITVEDNGTLFRQRLFSYLEPRTTGPCRPEPGMYTTVSSSLGLYSPSGEGGFPAGTCLWNLSLHDSPVETGPSISNSSVSYGTVTEEVCGAGLQPLPATPSVEDNSFGEAFPGGDTEFRPVRIGKYRVVRHYNTSGTVWAYTGTLDRFPETWREDYGYEGEEAVVPGGCDPREGIRNGYYDSGPGMQALLTREETWSSVDNGSSYTLLRSSDYTYTTAHREGVLVEYRASCVMERLEAGNLLYEDIYHYPVYALPGIMRVPSSIRHVEYHEEGNDTLTLTRTYLPRADLSVPVRLSSESFKEGGVTRKVRYTYADTYSMNPLPVWVLQLSWQHMLSEPIRTDWYIDDGTFPVMPSTEEATAYATPVPVPVESPYMSSVWSYSRVTIEGRSLLLPSRRREYFEGRERWSEETVSRDVMGNISSIREKGGPQRVIVWSWGGRHPLAVIENASMEEVRSAAGGDFIDGITQALLPPSSLLDAFEHTLRESPLLSEALVTTYRYSPGAGVTSVRDPAGVASHYGYDSGGRLSEVRDTEGNEVAEYTWDLFDDGGDGRRSAVTRVYRDSSGESFSEGTVWWNTLGLAVQERSAAASGDGRDLVTVRVPDYMMHDDYRVWLPYPVEGDGGSFREEGRREAEDYHGSGRAYLARRYEDSPGGRLLATALPGYDDTHQTEYTLHSPEEGLPVCLWSEERGRIVVKGTHRPGTLVEERVTDADGRVSSVIRDHAGRILFSRTGEDPYTVYAYDDRDRLRAVAGGDISFEDTLSMWRWGYDSLSRVSYTGIPGSVREYYTYDEGDRIKETRRGERRERVEHDAFGRVTAGYLQQGETSQEHPLSKHGYGSYGEREHALIRKATGQQGWRGPVRGLPTWDSLAVYDGEGDVPAGYLHRVRLYDSHGRVEMILSEYPDGAILSERIGRDFSGAVTSRILVHDYGEGADTLMLSTAYDLLGRPLNGRATLRSGGGDTVSSCSEYSYDALGRREVHRRSSSGVTIETRPGYALQGWVSEYITTLGGERLYDERLFRDTVEEGSGGVPSFTGLVAVKSDVYGAAQVSRVTGYAYDHAGRLQRESGGGGTTEYSYDAGGNLLEACYSSGEREEYTYQGDRLRFMRDMEGVTRTFSHDDCGRLSFDGAAGLQIGYNALDLVGTLLHEEGNAVIYSYTADGGKYSARREGGEGLLYRGPFLYRSDTLGGLSLESVASPEGRLTPRGAMLHVTDHTGSVVAVVSGGTAEVVAARSYDAWGRVKEEYGDSGYRYGFSGKENQYHDFGIPYSDFGARFYSPTLRRWLSPDPLSHEYLGSSHYAFCANNPVNIIDPDGRDVWYIDKNTGKIIKRIHDVSTEKFIIINHENKPVLELKYGTIEAKREMSYDKLTPCDIYQIRGDLNAINLFEFLANNTDVEWGHIKTGIEGKQGLNFITTSHSENKEAGLITLFNKQLKNGYTIREFIHNHPSRTARPSGYEAKEDIDGSILQKGEHGDLGVLIWINSHLRLSSKKMPRYFIYTIDKYTEYYEDSKKSDFVN